VSSRADVIDLVGFSLFTAPDYSQTAPAVELRIWNLQYYSPLRTYIADHRFQHFTWQT